MNPIPAPLDNAEHAASEALAPEWLSPLLRRRGVSGTVHSGGRVVREWDRFGWLEWARQADLMRLDPRVQMAWQARASELRAAQWTVTPADHPDGERYAEHVRKALGLDGEPGSSTTPERLLKPQSCSNVHGGSASSPSDRRYFTLYQ